MPDLVLPRDLCALLQYSEGGVITYAGICALRFAQTQQFNQQVASFQHRPLSSCRAFLEKENILSLAP